MKGNKLVASLCLWLIGIIHINAQICTRNLSQTPFTPSSISVIFTASAASTATQWAWYENGTNLTNSADYTVSGNVLTVRNPSNKIGRQYYCMINIPYCSLGATNVITLAYVPTITSTSSNAVCGGGAVTLYATASAGTINWYSSAIGGTSLGTGTSFTTPSLGTTTIYYVDATDNGVTSISRTAVTATVNAVPSITSTTPASRCGSGTVTLNAAANSGTITWYPSQTSVTRMGTGTSYITPSLGASTTYQVLRQLSRPYQPLQVQRRSRIAGAEQQP